MKNKFWNILNRFANTIWLALNKWMHLWRSQNHQYSSKRGHNANLGVRSCDREITVQQECWWEGSTIRTKNNGSCCHLPDPYLPGRCEWAERIPKSAVSDPPFPLLMLTLFLEVSPHVALSWICSRCRCLSWLATLALFMGEPERSKHNWMRNKSHSLLHDPPPGTNIQHTSTPQNKVQKQFHLYKIKVYVLWASDRDHRVSLKYCWIFLLSTTTVKSVLKKLTMQA
jgi:hypothetical protein